jgi:hypothetical protein
MTGTIINAITIIAGSLLGLGLGNVIPDRVQKTIVAGMGLFTAMIGIQMFLETENELIVLGGILLGGLLGEALRLEHQLNNLGGWLERRFSAPEEGESRFVKGFLTASLLFCIGPVAILGALQDGLYGDFQLLVIKAILDGFASLAFASSLGLGVIFSAPVVFVYQAGISLFATQLEPLLSPLMTAEMTATGGVLLLGLSISALLEIKKIRVGNLLPAIVISPLIVFLLALWGLI